MGKGVNENIINRPGGENSSGATEQSYDYEKTITDKLVFAFCYSFCFLVAAASFAAMIYVIVA